MLILMLVRAEEDMGHMVYIDSTITDGYLRSEFKRRPVDVLLSIGKVL